MTSLKLPKGRRLASVLAVASLLFAATGCASSTAPAESAATAASTATGTIRFGTDPTYPPFQYKEGENYTGFEIDVARAIGKAVGKNVEFSDVKYNVGIGALNADRFDALLIGGMADTEDRRKAVLIVDEYKGSFGFIVPKGNPKGLKDMAGACGLTVATFGGTHAAAIEAATKQCSEPAKALSLTDANGPYDAVQTGRADAYMGDYSQAVFQAKKMNADAIQVADSPTWLAGLALKLGNEDLAKEIATGLQKVIDSGEYEEIAKKYDFPTDALVKEATINTGEIPVGDKK